MQALTEKYGRTLIEEATDEIIEIDKSSDPPVARLTQEARKLSFQLLGPPPEMDMDWRMSFERERDDASAKAKKPAEENNQGQRTAATSPANNDGYKPEPTHSSTLMQQYREAKERHPGMILLFRCGDFYEVFDEDAQVAARLLGLALTTRDSMSMAGFPHHSLEAHLRKFLQAGHRVAICEPVDEATTIRREVTRIVTPGSIVDEEKSNGQGEKVNERREKVVTAYRKVLSDRKDVQFTENKDRNKGPFDFIVHQADNVRLVCVRKRIMDAERQAMGRWMEDYGGTCDAVQVWPVHDAGAWKWEEHIISIQPPWRRGDEGQLKRFALRYADALGRSSPCSNPTC